MRNWKEVIVAYFNVLFQHLPEGTDSEFFQDSRPQNDIIRDLSNTKLE